MLSLVLVAILVAAALIAFLLGRNRALAVASGRPEALHSLPSFHGAYLALWVFGPAFFFLLISQIVSSWYIESAVSSRFSDATADLSFPQLEAFMRDVRSLASGNPVANADALRTEAADVYAGLSFVSDVLIALLVCALGMACFVYAYRQIARRMRARHMVERVIRWIIIACSVVAILTTIGIVMSLIFESFRFFTRVNFFDFVFGLHWSPQSAFEGAGGDGSPVDNSNVFGAIPLFVGTLLITVIAMCVAAPIGLMSAIYLSDYASAKFRAVAKPVLEILAGVPTVVYGFFAALTVAPAIRGFGESFGLSVSSESALAAGLVMGIMIIPFVSSLSDDVINAVPQSLRDGSAGLGATKSETIRKVVLPAALPGIVSALMLAISRAIGETMIVVMAAGLAANLTVNPLEAVTTVTVQIVTLLVGDQEFDSAKTLAAFALGLVLFCITLALNVIALRVVQKYREQYD